MELKVKFFTLFFLSSIVMFSGIGYSEDKAIGEQAQAVEKTELPFLDPTIRATQYETRLKDLERIVDTLSRKVGRLEGRIDKLDQDLKEVERKV